MKEDEGAELVIPVDEVTPQVFRRLIAIALVNAAIDIDPERNIQRIMGTLAVLCPVSSAKQIFKQTKSLLIKEKA